MHVEFYISNKKAIDSLLEDPDFVTVVAKYGIVQSFTTKTLCNKYNICDKGFNGIYCAEMSHQFYKYAVIPSNVDSFVHPIFHYMFDVFKTGIYVCIKGGNIKTFLPFSNNNYWNDWGQNIKINKGKFKNNSISSITKQNPNKWCVDYCTLINTHKSGSKNLNISATFSTFLELITELCYCRHISDVCFFINTYNHPILKRDRHHPYDRLYPQNKLPDLGTNYTIPNNTPIFSQNTTSKFDDILLPNYNDIVSMFCPNSMDSPNSTKDNWSLKNNMAVYVGTIAGCGTKSWNNPRLKLYELAKESRNVVDVSITGIDEQLQVDTNGNVQSIDTRNYRISDVVLEQTKYKYIIHIQDHISSYELTNKLSHGGVILSVSDTNNKWNTWYSNRLIGWNVGDGDGTVHNANNAHYLIIKPDLSNLLSTVNWCREHDDLCKQISERSLEFYRSYIQNKNYMMDYMCDKLNDYSTRQERSGSSGSSGSSKKGVIIIPFRDNPDHTRQKQLNQTLKFFDGNLDFSLVGYKVITQPHDNKLFNRGLLLNMGVYKNPADYYILHDADLIPDKELLKQYYVYPTTPIHLGHRGQRWSGSNNKKFIGGILSINKYDFYRVNGFPNDFWGWGGEDDALSSRLRINGIEVLVPPVGGVVDLENLTIEQKLAGLKSTGEKNQTKREQLDRDKKSWFADGIRQITTKL